MSIVSSVSSVKKGNNIYHQVEALEPARWPYGGQAKQRQLKPKPTVTAQPIFSQSCKNVKMARFVFMPCRSQSHQRFTFSHQMSTILTTKMSHFLTLLLFLYFIGPRVTIVLLKEWLLSSKWSVNIRMCVLPSVGTLLIC